MALLYITEYAEVSMHLGGRVTQIPQEPPLASQVIAIGASSVQSTVFNAATQYVRLHADLAANFLFGTNPTAIKDSSARLGLSGTEYHAIPRGQAFKVAVIASTI